MPCLRHYAGSGGAGALDPLPWTSCKPPLKPLLGSETLGLGQKRPETYAQPAQVRVILQRIHLFQLHDRGGRALLLFRTCHRSQNSLDPSISS